MLQVARPACVGGEEKDRRSDTGVAFNANEMHDLKCFVKRLKRGCCDCFYVFSYVFLIKRSHCYGDS